jgi:lysophospholipase L1-like esterase
MATKGSRPVAAARNLALLLVPVLVLFLALELLTRLIDPSLPFQGEDDAVWSIHRRSPDPVLVYEPRPGARSNRPRVWDEQQTVTYAINALGLRDREDLRAAKPAGARRVLFLGDSVTFGLEVNLEETLVKQVERLLLETAPQLEPVQCLNLGVSGYSPLQEVTLLESKGLDFDPDLVVLCYNLNDPVEFSGELGYFFRREAQGRLFRFGGYRTGYWLGRSKFLGWLSYRIEKLLALQETRSHLQQVVEGARREQVKEVLAGTGRGSGLRSAPPPPEPTAGLAAGETWRWVTAAHRNPERWAGVRAAFTRLGAISQAEDIPVLLAILPIFVDEQPYPFAEVHRFVAAEARRSGLAVIDLQPGLGDDPLSGLSFDSLHPHTAGHRTLAEILAPEVARRLDR